MNKIIIDTNLWISFLLTRKFDFLDNLLDSGAVELVFCEKLLDELINVASRPKLKKFFSEEDWDYVSDIIDSVAAFYPVLSKVDICRDPKDNFLLALAQDSSADYLITGDNDLLVLKTFGRTQILTIAEFKILMHNF
jgi:putative PIN family toxin of toxin-antitoxin system